MNDLCAYGIADKNELVRVIRVEEETVIYFQNCSRKVISKYSLYIYKYNEHISSLDLNKSLH